MSQLRDRQLLSCPEMLILECQTILMSEATVGSARYSFNGQQTELIAFDASAAIYEDAFEVLPGVGAGNIKAIIIAGGVILIFDGSISQTLMIAEPDESADFVPTISLSTKWFEQKFS
jgi:hypothetical protein